VIRWGSLLVLSACLAGNAAEPEASAEPAAEAADAPATSAPEPRTLQVHFFRAELVEICRFMTSGGTPRTVAPDATDVKLTLDGDATISWEEMAWLLDLAANDRGLTREGSHFSRTFADPDPSSRNGTFFASTRDPDASRTAALAERVWRGRLAVDHRGDLLALTGPADVAMEAIAYLSERDHIATRPTGSSTVP